jgi:hypothetical protein
MNDATLPGGRVSKIEARRLDLLRQIAAAGGTLSPQADPCSKHGYGYPTVGTDVVGDLDALEKQHYLEARFFDRVSLCPKCDSHHLNVREICPGCRRAHLTSEGLLHHFRCGYVGLPSEFSPAGEGGYRCPKCNHGMQHLGIEYDRLGKAFQCRSCGLISDNPPVEAVCLACGARAPAENLVSAIVVSYVLTSRGASAIRRGSLLDDAEEPILVGEAPALRRRVIIEFLDHELKRLRQLKGCFSLLLARLTPEAMDANAGDSPTPWLIRLRQCLRDVDLLGQLAEGVYLVIVPQTLPREVEALRRRIESELGPQSPFALSAVEITDVEGKSLQQVLAQLHARSEA